MKIDIKIRGFDAEPELKHFVMCCAGFELGPHRGRIDSVQIHLIHAPEARARRDKHCLVEIGFANGASVSSRDMDMDMHVAIYRALEQAGWMSTQRLSREDLDVDSLPTPPPPPPASGEPNLAA